MVPAASYLIGHMGWQQALGAVCWPPCSSPSSPWPWALREPGFAGGAAPQREPKHWHALREAFGYRSFQLLMAGYFVCGFQVVFIGVHMPSYLKDQGMEPHVASTALALIGLFNIFGTYAAGSLGQIWPKQKILSGIYFARGIICHWLHQCPLSHPCRSTSLPR